MSSVRNIVKVMNFHALIRVDKAKKKVAKDQIVEKELNQTLAALVNNRNLRLDKKMLLSNPNGDILNIYLGNDYGFCGNFNHQLQAAILADKDAYKIVIGKKISHINDDKILLKIEKDEFLKDYHQINELVTNYIKDGKIKEINVVLNYYHSVSEITFERIRLFPVEIPDSESSNTNIDYVIETNINGLIASIISLGICYQIKIFESNSWASENVMREQITRESIKKIDEIEETKTALEKKNKKETNFKKQISNYKIVKE